MLCGAIAACATRPFRYIFSCTEAESQTDRLGPMHCVGQSCPPGMQCNRQHVVQGDRWEEGRDPELFNLRRRTSREEALASEQQPMQSVSSGRGHLGSGSTALLGDLPPHLLAQHASGKVPFQSNPSGDIPHRAEQLLCSELTSVPNGCGDAACKPCRKKMLTRALVCRQQRRDPARPSRRALQLAPSPQNGPPFLAGQAAVDSQPVLPASLDGPQTISIHLHCLPGTSW